MKEPTDQPALKSRRAQPEQTHGLRLALRFARGEGRLVAEPFAQGGVQVEELVLTLPGLTFPCSVTGGVDAFRDRPSKLHALVLHLDEQALRTVLRHADLEAQGLGPVVVQPHEGFVLLQGTLLTDAPNEPVPFSLRASVVQEAGALLTVSLYDLKLYGPAPVCPTTVPERLRLALTPLTPEVELTPLGASAWRCDGERLAATHLLPQHGFCVPARAHGQATVRLDTTSLRLQVHPAHAGAEVDCAPAALAAWRAQQHFAPAEQALRDGAFAAAARRFYGAAYGAQDASEGSDGQRPGTAELQRWARARCFALALFDDSLFERPLDWQDPGDALPLKLFAAAKQAQAAAHAEAALAYDAIAAQEPLPADRALALLALARECRATQDVALRPRAIEALQEAAGKATLPPYAQAWLCELLTAAGQHALALDAARAWLLALESQDRLDLEALAEASCTAARLCLAAGNLFEEAQEHLEQLLARLPNHNPALWQLLRVQGAACHIEAGRKTLEQLVAQARRDDDPAKAAQQLTALGDAAQDALGDRALAQALYLQALARASSCALTHLRLGALAADAGDDDAMVAHLQRLFAAVAAPEHRRAAALSDKELSRAHLMLGSHFMAHTEPGRGPRDLSLGLEHLRQAQALDDEREDVRLRLEEALRAAQDWSALAELLVTTGAQAAARGDVARARRWQLQAARLHLGERNEPHKALKPLLALVRQAPGDEEALAMLVPLLEGNRDVLTLRHVLEDAAQEPSLPPLRRGMWLMRLWRLEEQAGADAAVQLPILAQLLQIFPQQLAAATAQVQLLEGRDNVPREALPAHDRALADAYAALAQACVERMSRARAWRKAARALSYVGAPKEALLALQHSCEAAPLDVDSALLGAQLKHDVEGVEAARSWLAAAVAQAHGQPFAFRLYDRLAELAAFAKDTLGEIEALHSALALGGTSYALCMRLLTALDRASRHQERADWLMAWAKAGWPLEIASSYARAADIYASLGQLDAARTAYRALGQLDTQAMEQAGAALCAMGQAHNLPEDELEGLTLQHRAALKRHDKEAAAALSQARVLAHEAAGDAAAAEALCHELLAQEPRARLPHSCLAHAHARKREWASALDHGLQATLWGTGAPLPGDRSHACWSLTYGLALDLRPELQGELQAACTHKGMAVPYSARLVALGDFATAEHLYAFVLEEEPQGPRARATRRSLAALYTGPLGDIDKALQLLRENLAQDMTDVDSRRALLPVYRARGDTAQEAELHLALSSLVSDVQEALQHALDSAELYAQDPKERGTAEQIVTAFARRSDVPKVCPQLWQGLRRMGMLQELAHILAQGLEDAPAAEDGRFAALARLYAHELQEPALAVALCARMQQAFPQADAPWHVHIEILLGGEGRASGEQLLAVEGLYHAWAQLRQGEAQASILDALAQHLRGAGEAKAALVALEAALDVSDAGPERAVERLMVLCDRYLARADLPKAEQTLLRLLDVLPPSEAQDVQLRRLAELNEDHMDAPERALLALRRLTHPHEADCAAMTRLAVALDEAEVFAQLPKLCGHVPGATLWAMAQKLVATRDLAGARTVLSELMPRLPGPDGGQPQGEQEPSLEQVWALIGDVWHEHGAPRTLCAWRLQYGRTAPAPLGVRLQLQALSALHSDPQPADEPLLTADDEATLAAAMGRAVAEEVLGQALTADVEDLGQAFALATTLRLTDLREQLAQAWLEAMPKSDSRRADPVLVVCEAALAAGDCARALAYAEELEALGDALGEPMMLRALAAQPDRGPYLLRLLARVQVTHGEPKPAHLQDLAREQQHQGQHEAAQHSLQRVPLLARDHAWAALAVQVYASLGEHLRHAEAAALAAHLAPSREVRAQHLRDEAQVRWWELGDVATAHRLLHQAQAHSPLRYQDLDATLGQEDVAQARQRLHEALVVMPAALAATLWRRLAALLPHGPSREEALQEALNHAGEDTHELGLLAEAARAGGTHKVLQGALLRLAELAAAQDPRRAARLWLEAAHGREERDAAPLWVRAATALFSVGAQDEAASLVQRALAAGCQSLEISTLVWRHLPEETSARTRAARVLAQHNDACAAAAEVLGEPDATVVVEDTQALHIAAGEAALRDGAAQEAVQYGSWALAHNVDASGAAIDAALCESALLVQERALEALGHVPGLVALWRQGCRMLIPAHPWVISRRRRAAYLAVAMLPDAQAESVWAELLEAEPNLFEAQVQHWGRLARSLKAKAALARMEQDLQPLAPGPHRTALTLAGARLLQRRYTDTEAAITWLGAQLRLAMGAWNTEHNSGTASERSPTWGHVAALGDALADALAAAGSPSDRLAVLAHCARVAPPAEGLPRLAQAGLLALGAGESELAYTLLYPVAVAPPHGGVTASQTDAAQAFVCAAAQERRDAPTVVDLLTRMAQRAAPKQASDCFAQAATWADEGQLGQDQALRLLQASYALRPEPQVACRLIEGLMQRGDVAALIAAHYIFIQAALDSVDTERLGVALIAALGAHKARAAEREAATERLWQAIDARLPELPAADGYRLREARRANDAVLLLQMLERYLAHHREAPDAQALHAEAAQVAWGLGQPLRAWPHCRQALAAPQLQVELLAAAFDALPALALAYEAAVGTAEMGSADLDEVDAPGARTVVLGHIAAQAQALRALAEAKRDSHPQAIVSLRLLAALAAEHHDTKGLIWAQQALWQRVKDSGTKPDRRLAAQVSAELCQLLSDQGDWEPLAAHLHDAARRAPDGEAKGTLLWRQGDVCRLRLSQYRAALEAYAQALEHLPAPLTLRMAAAHMALKVGEPLQALTYVAFGAHERATGADLMHLELLLQAMVAADVWEGIEEVTTELVHRSPGNLFALHARAVHHSRAASEAPNHAADREVLLAAAEEGWAALAAALNVKDAAPNGVMCPRGDALEQVARYARARQAPDRACQALRAAIQCDGDKALRARRMELLTQACLEAGHTDEAALLAEARAEDTQEPAVALACWIQAADIWQHRCRKPEAALRALWQAAAVAPDRSDVWLMIMDRLPEPTSSEAAENDWLTVAEKLLVLSPRELQQPGRLSALGTAYARHDPPRALGLFAQAEAAGGVVLSARPIWESVAWQCDDLTTFVPLAKAFEAADSAAPSHEFTAAHKQAQLLRRVRLAEALLLRGKGSRKEGIRFLRGALTLLPHPSTAQDVPALRQVASICATEPEYADIALKLYAIVLEHTPLDVEALRIAARLAGQHNMVDRAYGLYACLLWLFPMDQEAKAFVEACRAQGGAAAAAAKSGPWVKRVQQALDELVAQGAQDSTLSTAKTFNVAQLLRRDIEVVLSDLLPLPSAQVARGRALSSSPEAMALFRLAQSSHYVQLRHKLGANLVAAPGH